ncbi:MAG: hypothetical protein JHD35_17715, partial [Sphingopyxis sp.]|nr:hypothetical protein [Sphingopyxis sp.]
MKPEQLAPREKEVLRLLLYPMRPLEIARAMNIKVNTVNTHLASSRRKLVRIPGSSRAVFRRDAAQC